MRLAVSVLILSVAGAASAAGTSVVITDVTVVPMDSERLLAHRTVLVTDGAVARIGPAGAVKTPKGAVHVNGRGRAPDLRRRTRALSSGRDRTEWPRGDR